MSIQRKGLVIVYYGDGKGKTTAAMGLATRALGRGLKVHVIQFIKGTWTTGEMEALQKLGAGFEQMGKGFYKIMNDQVPPEEHKKAARNGFNRALALMNSSISGLSSQTLICPPAGRAGDPETNNKKKKNFKSFGFLFSFLDSCFPPRPASGETGRRNDGKGGEKKECLDILILDEILRAVQEELLSKDDINRLIEQKPQELHLVITGHTVWPELVERADMVTEMKKIKHPFDRGILAQIGVDF